MLAKAGISDEVIISQIRNSATVYRLAAADIIAAGFDEETVKRVITMVDRNEYKRQQAAPGLKVTSRAFGTGWRMPIVRGE